jgi:integrase/recombinase XerD
MATKLLWLGMDIADVQRILGYESIMTTRHYAETRAATRRRKFDRVTAKRQWALLQEFRWR